jgi:hypothetical protein
MKSGSGGMLVLLVLLVAVGEVLWVNPIRFHRRVTIDGYTVHVPVLWTPVKDPGQGVTFALRREWTRSAAVAVIDRRQADAASGPWTMEQARKEQALVSAMQSRNPDFHDARTFDVAGKFTAVCQEATAKGNEALVCFLVGTPLEFSYLGSARYEPDARRMIGSVD